MATFVEVVWHDAHADTSNWIDIGEVGFDQLDCVLAIPVAMVKSMRAIFAGGLDTV